MINLEPTPLQPALDFLVNQAQENDGFLSKTIDDGHHQIKIEITPSQNQLRNDRVKTYVGKNNKAFWLHNLDESVLYTLLKQQNENSILELRSFHVEQLPPSFGHMGTPIDIEQFNSQIEATIQQLKTLQHAPFKSHEQ